MEFIPLHIYTGNSFLKSGLATSRYVALAKKRGFSSLGICDLETLSAAPEFYLLATKNDLNPIIGEDIIFDDLLFSLFIVNEKGYHNLLKLQYLKKSNQLTKEKIKEHNEGLIAILKSNNFSFGDKQTILLLADYSKLFQEFYIGLDYNVEEEELNLIRNFVKKYPYSLIAFPFIRYEKREDAITLEIVEAIANDTKLTKTKQNGEEYFLSDLDISNYYLEDEISALSRFKEINFNLIQKRGHLLRYPNDLKLNSDDYLAKITSDRLKTLGLFTDEYKKRLDYELDVIKRMGYSDYFLLVSDYVNYAKNNGISVGPGRGSAAGSLVSFALNITVPDPIKYDLLFERFLNINRSGMPDIDVDFSDINRYKVIDYLKDKYGKTHVANIMTVQTIGAKQSLRDVGRVYDYETREIDLISKTIVNSNLSLRDNYRTNEQFRRLVDSDKYYLNIVSLASKIEGLPRQSGLHAAGIIINDEPLEDVIPCIVNDDGTLVAEYEMNYLQDQGFLKMDILGLRNLTIIDDCLLRIKNDKGIELKYEDLPFDDKKAIGLIRDNFTMGIFQLESSGMKKAVQTIKPTSFEDVVAILALFRPGPMENIPTYARRKKGIEKVSYISPLLKDILAPTYGIIIYQEQIIQIANKVALFPMEKADIFRSAISKKDSTKLEALKVDFIKGCILNKIKKEDAEKIYNLIYRFANYGFNRSHSLSYAIIALQMAYLKAYYPEQFYASILDNTSSKDSTFSMIISEMKKISLTLALPNINISKEHYIVHNGKVYFPLSQIKGAIFAQIQAILIERDKNGAFIDFADFVARVTPYKVGSATISKLIDAGALDSLHPSRASLRASLGAMIMYASTVGEYKNALGLEGVFPKPQIKKVEDDKIEDLNKEYDLLGVMLSGSPLSVHSNLIKAYDVTKIVDIPYSYGTIKIVGFIKNEKKRKTKNGTMMAFLLLSDESGEIEVAIFDEVYNVSFGLLKKGNIIVVEGYYLKNKNSFNVQKISSLEEMKNE